MQCKRKKRQNMDLIVFYDRKYVFLYAFDGKTCGGKSSVQSFHKESCYGPPPLFKTWRVKFPFWLA